MRARILLGGVFIGGGALSLVHLAAGMYDPSHTSAHAIILGAVLQLLGGMTLAVNNWRKAVSRESLWR